MNIMTIPLIQLRTSAGYCGVSARRCWYDRSASSAVLLAWVIVASDPHWPGAPGANSRTTPQEAEALNTVSSPPDILASLPAPGDRPAKLIECRNAGSNPSRRHGDILAGDIDGTRGEPRDLYRGADKPRGSAKSSMRIRA